MGLRPRGVPVIYTTAPFLRRGKKKIRICIGIPILSSRFTGLVGNWLLYTESMQIIITNMWPPTFFNLCYKSWAVWCSYCKNSDNVHSHLSFTFWLVNDDEPNCIRPCWLLKLGVSRVLSKSNQTIHEISILMWLYSIYSLWNDSLIYFFMTSYLVTMLTCICCDIILLGIDSLSFYCIWEFL